MPLCAVCYYLHSCTRIQEENLRESFLPYKIWNASLLVIFTNTRISLNECPLNRSQTILLLIKTLVKFCSLLYVQLCMENIKISQQKFLQTSSTFQVHICNRILVVWHFHKCIGHRHIHLKINLPVSNAGGIFPLRRLFCTCLPCMEATITTYSKGVSGKRTCPVGLD